VLSDRTDPVPDAAGAAGRRVFTVRVAGPGELSALLRRAWEPPEATGQAFTATVAMR
jgi:hypothetical protein